MESSKPNLNLDFSDEFYDAVDSLNNSLEPLPKTPTLKEFSPITKFSQSDSCFKLSNFATTPVLSQTIKTKSVRVFKVKDNLKKNNKDYYEFYNLSLIQEFRIGQERFALIEFSPDGRFLCIAGENPRIVLHEVCRQTFVDEEQFLLYDEPMFVFLAHTSRVSCLAWMASGLFFVSGSVDGMVYWWSVGEKVPVGVFKHNVEVVFVDCCVWGREVVVTGGKDCRVRVWDCGVGRVEADVLVQGEITAGKICPNGQLIIGLNVGMCLIFNYNSLSKSLDFQRALDCRNKRGPKSSGRNITGFDFVDNLCLISSNDSRIRLFDLNTFEIVQKYKGLKNDSSKIAAKIGGGGRFVVSGSENGCFYVWNLKNVSVPKFNPIFTKKQRYKNSSFEYVIMDKNKTETVARFASDRMVANVQRRYVSARVSVDIHSIVVAVNKGVLFVYYNKILQARKSMGINKALA